MTGRNPDWARPGQQPAYVRSSDAKSLKTDEAGKPKANSLGYRYTWLKCSKPSIAALKQAFRDQDSRICLDDTRPSDGETHPRIKSISLANTRYLQDQKVVFSQNLNTLIGARGTGKSTILELLRIMFAREQSDALSEKTLSKANRAKDTLLANAQIHVEWEGIPGQVDTLHFSPDNGLSLAVGDAFDLATYLRHLPVQFYSQQQLSDLTAPSGQPQLLEMLDEACADDLNRLDCEERTLVAQIKRLFAAQDQVTAIDQQIVSLSQELVELERQWQARKDVQGEAAAYQQAQRAKRYLQGLHDQVEKDIEAVKFATTALCVNADNGAVVADFWPHAEWMTSHTIATSAIRERFKKRLTSLLEEIATESDALFAQNAQRSEVIRTLDAAQLAFVKACEAKGIQTQDVSRLQELDRSKQAKQLALDDKKRERQALDGTAKALEDGLSQLFAVWASQTACRTRVAAEVTKKTGNSIRVSIKPMAYQPHFEKLWMTIEPDRRTRVGREWQVLGETFSKALARRKYRQHLLGSTLMQC